MQDLQEDVMSRAFEEGQETLQDQAFADYVLEAITDEGEWPQHELARYRQNRRGELAAWGIDEDNRILYLCVTDWLSIGVVQTLPQSVVTDQLKRLATFLERALAGTHEIEEGSEAAEAARAIEAGNGSTFTSARLFLLSNRKAGPSVRIPEPGSLGLPATSELWDLEKIAAVTSAGQPRETIEVDFQQSFGRGLPCLHAGRDGTDVEIYSAFIPGEVLGSIYRQFGPRLLELNVRSFLQARGKVNQGIRDTIRNDPGRFLAYNNGITATASEVKLSSDGTKIRRLRDLQIVNGGQTTASLARALDEDVDLSTITVQMKLAKVDPALVKTLVPEISKYANRQNAVSEADLTANHPFHVCIEELSDTVPVLGDGTIATYWFYEKNRGSYQNKIAEAGTAAQKNRVRAKYPSAKKFTKTDLAKFHNTWAQRPWIVARGAMKSFGDFMVQLEEDSGEIPKEPDETFFKELVAKAILFKETDRIVREQDFGGWKAQIVTYTIAHLSKRLRGNLDFGRIWDTQRLWPELVDVLADTCRVVHRFLTVPPDGQNIGEFSKKEQTWEDVAELTVNASTAGLTGAAPRSTRTGNKVAEPGEITEAREVVSAWLEKVEPEEIASLAAWAAENSWNIGRARRFLAQMATWTRAGTALSPKQAAWLHKLWAEALEEDWQYP
ncbi:AIPR family protein [bacterium AH-315-A03]|nr:AIPR family protein [bacterium AH-315-A03]